MKRQTCLVAILGLLAISTQSVHSQDTWENLDPSKVRAFWILPTNNQVDLRFTWFQIEYCPTENPTPNHSPCTQILSRVPIDKLTTSGEWELSFDKGQAKLFYKHGENTISSFAVAQSSIVDGWFEKAELCHSASSRMMCKAIFEFNQTLLQTRLRLVFEN